ncbi:MAG: hypothetical protein JSR46_06305, partial [Verrucomicrobia bacterium]|nr:hypothetical protein [Verrucomicrobiota bacterium]
MTQVQSHDPIGVFFWARSGNGHRTAKEGVKQQKIAEYGPQLDTSRDYDITGDKVLGHFGEMGVKAWDDAQKRGDLKFLEQYSSWGWIGEIIFYPLVYFKVKWLLQELKQEPEFIVSTQAFCLKAIVHAMQTVNKERKWQMHMDLHLADLPSKKMAHFFPSIRSVTSDKHLGKLLTLHAAPPRQGLGLSEREFWHKYCGKVNVVTNEPFPIREAFLNEKKLKEKLEKPVV